MLAVDRVGGRLEAAVGGAREFYKLNIYSPSEELRQLYALHVANTSAKNYTILLANNARFQINKELACMLSQVIDTKNRRWTGSGQDDEMDMLDVGDNLKKSNEFYMTDVKLEEFTVLLELACGITKSVRVDRIERYIQITLEYAFVDTLREALTKTAMVHWRSDVTGIISDARDAVNQANIDHMNALEPVQAAETLPRLYLFSPDHIQDSGQLHVGRYYGCKQFKDRGSDAMVLALFLDVAFDKMRAYVRINNRVDYTFISHLYPVLSFDNISPVEVKPSQGYFESVRFDRGTHGDCVGHYFECDAERLRRFDRQFSASRPIMVWLLGYSSPNTACVFYDDKAWYIQTDYLSLVIPDALTLEEESERTERNELIQKTKLGYTEVECDAAAITDKSQLQKGELYGCPFTSLSTSGRSFARQWSVSVMYLGPCIKHEDMVYIFYDNEEHLVQLGRLYRITHR
jgi:hypothetical protein